MKLSAMRYKDYVWPHNPKIYEITYRRDVVSYRVPFSTYMLQDMGRQHRVLRGEGEFVGEGAYTEFKKLATLFYETTPGILVHPLWDAAKAYFVGLHLKQEPTENYVAYSFEFWECFDGLTNRITLARQSAEGTGQTRTAAAAGAGTAVNTASTGAAADYAAAASTGGAEYYTAAWGDCLWLIAKNYGLSLEKLLALNPQVKNPNLICAGDVIRVK